MPFQNAALIGFISNTRGGRKRLPPFLLGLGGLADGVGAEGGDEKGEGEGEEEDDLGEVEGEDEAGEPGAEDAAGAAEPHGPAEA